MRLRLEVMRAVLLQRFYAILVPIKPIRLDEPRYRPERPPWWGY